MYVMWQRKQFQVQVFELEVFQTCYYVTGLGNTL